MVGRGLSRFIFKTAYTSLWSDIAGSNVPDVKILSVLLTMIMSMMVSVLSSILVGDLMIFFKLNWLITFSKRFP